MNYIFIDWWGKKRLDLSPDICSGQLQQFFFVSQQANKRKIVASQQETEVYYQKWRQICVFYFFYLFSITHYLMKARQNNNNNNDISRSSSISENWQCQQIWWFDECSSETYGGAIQLKSDYLRVRRFWVINICLFCFVLLLLNGCSLTQSMKSPFQFNHALHLAKQAVCTGN